MSPSKDASVFLVTGAASGIGAGLARALLARGEAVCAADIQPLHALTGDPARLLTATLDVRDAPAWPALIERVVARWGRLDVLLNVAGVLKPGYVQDTTAADVDFHIDINLKGVIHGTRAAAQQMLRQGHGHIVNIASLAGLAPVPGLNLYSASKFAVRGYSLAVAQELKTHDIRVSVVCPDAVQTPMLDLQKDYEQAALTFSGGAGLSVEQVTRAILDHVLVHAPLELALPAGRGWISRLAGAFPALAWRFTETFRQRGLRQQRRLRALADR